VLKLQDCYIQKALLALCWRGFFVARIFVYFKAMQPRTKREADFSYYLAWGLVSFIMNSFIIGCITLDDRTPQLDFILNPAFCLVIGFDGLASALLIFYKKTDAAFAFLIGAILSLPALYILALLGNNALTH
jgi:hypothetical protein